MDLLKDSLRTVSFAASKERTAVLFFSGSGKDSIALLNMITPYFDRVYAVYLYIVKDLNIIEPFLLWAEKFKNVTVIQLPHPDFYMHNKVGLYKIARDITIKEVKFKDIENYLKRKYFVSTFIYGHKIQDSFIRRGMFNDAAKSDIHFQSGRYYPIVKWSNKNVIDYIKANNLPKPLRLGSRRHSSGISLRPPILFFIKQHYPLDYQKIIREYPLVDLVVQKFEIQHGTDTVSKIRDKSAATNSDQKRTIQPQGNKRVRKKKTTEES